MPQPICLLAVGVRDVAARLHKIYRIEMSPDLISQVTDAVLEWRGRLLERLYTVMFIDALRVKVRGHGTVSNKAVYLAWDITPDCRKHIS